MLNINIAININDNRWQGYADGEVHEILCKLANLCIDKSGMDFSHTEYIELSLNLTNDKEIQELNRDYRGKNKPTNVLSFPQYTKDELSNGQSIIPFLILGDIIVSFDTIEKESKEQEKNFSNHFLHMFTHSVLHLLGFDHIIEEERKKMETMEIDILKAINIANPYVVN